MRGARKTASKKKSERATSKRWEESSSSHDPGWLPEPGWRPEDASEEDDSDTDKPEGMLDQENLVGREAKRQRHVLSNRRYMERVVNVSQLARFMEQYVIVTPNSRAG